MVSIKLQFQVKGSPFPPPSEDGSIHGEDSVSWHEQGSGQHGTSQKPWGT